MVYQVGKKEPIYWYASFLKKQEWQINKTKNISKKVIEEWLTHSELLLIA